MNKRLTITILLFLVQVSAVEAQFFSLVKYGVSDGLKSDYLNNVFHDSKGYLWISDGSFGVTRYDGKTFKNFNDKKEDIINNSNFVQLNGKIRLVSGGAIYEIDGDSIITKLKIDKKAYTNRQGERDIISLKRGVLDNEGIMWVSPEAERMYAFDGKKTIEFKTPGRRGHRCSLNSEGHNFYYEVNGTQQYIHILRWENYKIKDFKHLIQKKEEYIGTINNQTFTSLVKGDSTIITWYNGNKKNETKFSTEEIGHFGEGQLIEFDNGICVFSTKGLIYLSGKIKRVFLFNNPIINLFSSAHPIKYNQKILFSNQLFDGNKVIEIIKNSEIPNSDHFPITGIVTDNENNIWYSTLDGLYKVFQTPIKSLKLPKSYYAGMDKGEKLYFFKENNGAHDSLIITDRNLITKKIILFAKQPNVDILESNGEKTFISADLNNYSIVKDDFSVENYIINKAGLMIEATTMGGAGSIQYFLNYQYAFSKQTGNFYFINKNNLVILNKNNKIIVQLPVPSNKINLNKLYIDKNESIYICYSDEILCYTNDKITKLNFESTSDKFQNYSPILNYKDSIGIILIPNDSLKSIFLSSKTKLFEYKIKNNLDFSLSHSTTNKIRGNNFWIGNVLFIPLEGYGIIKLSIDFSKKEVLLTEMGKLQGLPSTRASACVIDSNERIWIFNNISRTILNYSQNDFLAGNLRNFMELYGSPLTAFISPQIDKSGFMYVSVDDGLLVIDTDTQLYKKSKNFPFIEKVSFMNNNSTIRICTDNSIPYNSSVLFDYNFIQFNNNNKLLYSYKLEGLEGGWQFSTENKSIKYYNLPAGHYNFSVRVFSNNSWIECEKSVAFTVSKPFWEQWWFVILTIITFIILIRFYIRFREHKLKVRQFQLEKTIEERTKEVVNEKKIVEEKSQLIEEKQKEILDSLHYAKRIQNALITNENYIEKHMKRLKKNSK